MPLARVVARANRRVTNPILNRIAPRAPLFGQLTHVGRRSGRTYRIPILVFGRGDRRVIALTYGEDVDWLRNVLAAGGCEIRSRGHRLVADRPVVHRDATAGDDLPWLVRQALRRTGVHAFLHLRVRPADG